MGVFDRSAILAASFAGFLALLPQGVRRDNVLTNIPSGKTRVLDLSYAIKDTQGKMHFPGFSVDAVKILIDRRVSGLGCDTASADYGASSDFAVHHLSLGAGLYHLENLSDLSELPESGAFLIVAPIKLEGGSGGPVRVFAVLE